MYDTDFKIEVLPIGECAAEDVLDSDGVSGDFQEGEYAKKK